MEKTLQEQLTEVETQLEQEKAKGVTKDADLIAHLEEQQAMILKQMDEETAKAEQEAAHKVVIKEATEKAAYIMDNLIIEGLTIRQLAAGEQEYQLLKIGVQGEFIAQAEAANTAKQLSDLAHKEETQAGTERELQLKRQNDKLQEQVDKQAGLELEVKLANAQRDAAMAKVDGLELLLKTKQEEIELLRTEKAIGARNAINVIDVEAQREQMKTLAEQIKASRIHVYDVVPDNDINPKNYTAKRADNGEIVTYNWTQVNKYIVLTNAEEVSQFRAQHEHTIPDLPLVETPAPFEIVTAEQFRNSMDSVQASETVSQENAGVGTISGNAESVSTATVTRNEFEALKADVEVLKRRNGMVA